MGPGSSVNLSGSADKLSETRQSLQGNFILAVVVGAVAGAIIGAASDASRQEQAERIQERYERRDAQSIAEIERRAADYRRAMAACLEGRGYTVQ